MAEDTLRRRIISLLSSANHPMTAADIKRALGLPPETRDSEVYSAIEHAAKTLRRESGGAMSIAMLPARCKKCGYVFRTRKPRKPSRCPRCKSEQIEPPAFLVVRG